MTTSQEHLAAFISGPLDVDSSYFDAYYRPAIDVGISSNHTFIIGPVSGIYTLALNYLVSHIDPSRVSIYMTSWEAPSHRTRLEALGVNQVVLSPDDAVTTRERDSAMTRESDYDILRFRTEKECHEMYGKMWRARVSNTEMNWRRRRGNEGEGYVRHVSKAQSGGVWRGWSRKEEHVRKEQDGRIGDVAICDGSCDGHRS